MFLVLGTPPGAAAKEADDSYLRAELDRARELSRSVTWQEIDTILTVLEPLLDEADLREYADFHLLRARNLTLDDRSHEALELTDHLLTLDIDPDQRLRALQFAANVAVLLREYEQAFDYLLAALDQEARLEGPPVELRTYGMAAYMFGRVGELERAIDYGHLAVERARSYGTPADECVAHQRLAPVYKWAEQFDQAEAEYRRGMAVCQAKGNELFVGVIQHGLADLLRHVGRPDEARSLAEQSIKLLDRTGFTLGEYEARLVLSEILHDLDEVPGSETDLEEMIEYFRDRELWDQLARLEALQARIAERYDDAVQALVHLRAQMDARERFLSRDRAMRLAYLEVQFDTRLKEQEIELLRESARAAELEAIAVRQQRQFRTISLVLAGILLIMVSVLLVHTIRSRHHFRRLSRHDSLTTVANHTWFFKQAQIMLERARRAERPFFLVLADIDHFKQVNDTHGHPVGDEVLCRTARGFENTFGPQALVGRLGGEEFGIAVTAESAERLVALVEQMEIGEPPDALPAVTLSYGIARAQPGDDIISLRKRADQALYQAKSKGRNRVVIAGID